MLLYAYGLKKYPILKQLVYKDGGSIRAKEII